MICLASNNNFDHKQEIYLLENYFQEKINSQLLNQFYGMKCASLLRETMWSMVSEIYSKINVDYSSYTQENLKNIVQKYGDLIEHVHVSDENLNAPGSLADPTFLNKIRLIFSSLFFLSFFINLIEELISLRDK